MQKLRIDEKWEIEYDETDNCRPIRWLRNGYLHDYWDVKNSVTALFYALLEEREKKND